MISPPQNLFLQTHFSFVPGGLRELPPPRLPGLGQQEPVGAGGLPAAGAVPVSAPGGGVPAPFGAPAAGALLGQLALFRGQRLVTAHLVLRGAIQTGASGMSQVDLVVVYCIFVFI